VRQASIGNPNLKPATSNNSNLGLIFQKNSLRLSLDIWEIDYKDRIEVESAQAILSSDPNGSSITRNEFGDLIGVTTTYFNEDNTLVRGMDIQMQYLVELIKGSLSINLLGTNLSDFKTPSLTNSDLMINRVGKFNFDSHTFSLPKKRINSFISWNYNSYSLNLNSRYLDGYINERTITGLGLTYGYDNQVKSFFVHDISFGKNINTTNGNLDLKLYLSNMFDKAAPRLYDAPDFSFDTRLHDPRGRILGLNVEYNF
jgi:iron complex outermembrane receptor protein